MRKLALDQWLDVCVAMLHQEWCSNQEGKTEKSIFPANFKPSQEWRGVSGHERWRFPVWDCERVRLERASQASKQHLPGCVDSTR